MRTFELHTLVPNKHLIADGTSKLAEGVEFENGKCAMTWLTEFTSIAVYETISHLMNIHLHEGKTRIVFLDRHVLGPT